MTFRLGLALPLTSDAPTVGRLLDEVTAEAIVAEQAGFDLLLVPEHHQGPQVGYSAPLTIAALLLAATRRITVATGVLVLPSHHPLHVAESMSMLDHASGGRFALGVGAGYQAADLEPFGIALPARAHVMDEWLEVLGRLLREPEVTHHGARLTLDGVKLRPRPATRPNPPIWLGSWSRTGVRRAARLCDGWIADPIRSTFDVREMADAYRAACADAGHAPGPVVVMREAWVDDNESVARQRFAQHIEPVFGYYHRRGAFPEGTSDFNSLARDRFIVGSVDDVRAGVLAVAAQVGADAVVLQLRHPGGPGHSEAMGRIAATGSALSGSTRSSGILVGQDQPAAL